jgi:hypothetical protein
MSDKNDVDEKSENETIVPEAGHQTHIHLPDRHPPLSVDEGMVRTVGDYVKDIVDQFTTARLETDRIQLKEKEAELADRERARKHGAQLAMWQNESDQQRERTVRLVLPISMALLVAAVVAAIWTGRIGESAALIVAVASLIYGLIQQLITGRRRPPQTRPRDDEHEPD